MELDDELVKNLLDRINHQYGYDFSQYSSFSIVRRIGRFQELKKIESKERFLSLILNDKSFFESFLEELTVNVTEFFRDPTFYKSVREKVIPQLETYPSIKVWAAGCSTGEEPFSLSILLKEEGLRNSRIFATDINNKVLTKASAAEYCIKTIHHQNENYVHSGGKKQLSDYFIENKNTAKGYFDPDSKKNITFLTHNLVTDRSFNEFNLIVCRNVLIYFNKELQNEVFKLFLDSLCIFGYLALGSKESIFFSNYSDHFEIIDKKERIFRRVK